MEVSKETARFAQGNTAASEVQEAHRGTTFESFEQRLTFFWV